MRFLSTLFYYLSEAFVNVWSNKIMNILSIGTIAISLFILGIFLLVSTNLSGVISEWGEKVQVNIYLKNNISQNNFLFLRDRIESSPEVESFRYVSQQDALKEFRELFGKYETFSDKLEEDVFPASFEIKIKSDFRTTGKIEKFTERFANITGIEEIQYDREWILRLNTIINLIRLLAVTIGGILILAAISTTSNVIKMTILSRKDEIEVMRLVGASNSFIKGPFFFEGFIQGLTAGGIAVGLLYFLFKMAKSYIATSAGLFFTYIDFSFLNTPEIVLFIIGGTLVGTLGSLLSLGRFLKI
jgi:cell division transport system permease protein